jgi:purine-nucleoside phosphorylase
MPTPHNEAKVGEIAKTVIMPGDPIRAKKIALKYLENPKLVNKVRGMYAYTGMYHGKEITVMAHGMGMASAGIYFYELYKYYKVDTIIRIGSCGAYGKDLKLLDTILVDNSYTESNYAFTLNNEKVNVCSGTTSLNSKIENVAKKNDIKIVRGNTICSDCFDWYMKDVNEFIKRFPKKSNIIACEMEAFALFYIAKYLKKKAACLLTVVDSKFDKEEVSAKKRESSMNDMIELALKSTL